VKSIDVELVGETVVPDVMTLAPITGVPPIVGLFTVGLVNVLLVNVCVASVPTSVVVAAGSVAVKLLALLGEAMVNTPAPLALPVIATELM